MITTTTTRLYSECKLNYNLASTIETNAIECPLANYETKYLL